MEEKMKHLEIIQGVITRMASNSFALKGWAVTLVAGIFALANKDANGAYFLVAYIPIIVFWGLDAYYLLQEKLFRALYDHVRMLPNNKIDFAMNTSPKKFHEGKNTYGWCFVSKTIMGFYLPLAIVVAGIIILTHM